MSRWKPLIEFLLIMAGAVFSCTSHVLDEEAPGRTALRPTSFLQRAPLPDRSPPSSSQATIHPYSHSQALTNRLGHGIARGIPSAPTAEMLKAESIPLTKSQAVWKPIEAARTTLVPSELQTDWTETHKTRTGSQETTSTPPLSASRKKVTPVLNTTKENTNMMTVSRATEQHTTKLRKHTTVEKTSSATDKSMSSSSTPRSQTGPTLAPQPSPALTGAYSVSNGTANCIKALVGLTMIVINTKTGDLEYFNIDPNITHTAGYCGYGQSMLNISFEGGFVHLIFTKKEKIYYISMIEASLTILSQGFRHHGIKNDQLFSTAVGNSFKCLSKQTVGLASNFQLQAANSQFQAFDIVNNQFGKEEECTLDRNKKLIPATVGFSLSGLVIIILFSWVLYRRKPHNGYSRI